MKKIVIVSHSGGLDSSVLISKAISFGYDVQPINFNYGQKNLVEITSQKRVVERFKEMYGDRIKDTINIDFNKILKPVIKQFQEARDSGKIQEKTDLEYYMPFRNLTFASMCGMIGEMISMYEEYDEVLIGLGVHLHSEGNYSKNYWDITPEFVEKLNAVMELNDSGVFGIFAPYKDGYKNDIINDAKLLDVPYELTWTCYNPIKEIDNFINNEITIKAIPCLCCESCKERESMGQMSKVIDINNYSVSYVVNS